MSENLNIFLQGLLKFFHKTTQFAKQTNKQASEQNNLQRKSWVQNVHPFHSTV